MIRIYKNGAWHPLSGQKIRVNGQWKTLTDDDRFYFYVWRHLGDHFHHLMTTTKAGSFGMDLRCAPWTAESLGMRIDWGDGTVAPAWISITDSNLLHTYFTIGEKQIHILKDICARLSLLYCVGQQLTSLDVSVSTALENLKCSGNQLTSETVNDILHHFAALGKTYGTLHVQGQTPPAPPTGQGLIDKQTLIDRNWDIITD